MRSHHCPRCQKVWRNVPDHVVQLWHQCKEAPAPRSRFDFSVEEVNEADRANWAADLFDKEMKE